MTPKSAQQSLSTYAYLWSLYVLTVGSVYLWGYWSPFNINILEYMSVGDVVKATALPIASTFVFLALGVVLGEATGSRNYFPVGEGRDFPLGVFLRKYAKVFHVLYILATLAVLFFGPKQKWLILPLLFAMPIALYLDSQAFLSPVIPSERSRSLAIFLLAMLPFFAFGLGDRNASEILGGNKFQYALSPVEGVVASAESEPTKRPRFIGHAGDFLFFWEPENSLLIISKFEDGKSLVLGRYLRSAVRAAPARTH